jgi:hypothetical protein
MSAHVVSPSTPTCARAVTIPFRFATNPVATGLWHALARYTHVARKWHAVLRAAAMRYQKVE